MKVWQRPEQPVAQQRKSKPIEEKESDRWLEGYHCACKVKQACPATLVVTMADREGDIQEWFVEAMRREPSQRAEFIIRAKCHRRIGPGAVQRYVWAEMQQTRSLGTLTIELARQPERPPRLATLAVTAKPVTFYGARRPGGKLPPVTVSAVYAQEPSPPPGEAPVEWLLLTSLPVTDFPRACLVVQWYRCRWDMEVCQTHPLKMPRGPLRLFRYTRSNLRGGDKREHALDVSGFSRHEDCVDPALGDGLPFFKRELGKIRAQYLAKRLDIVSDLLPMDALVPCVSSWAPILGNLGQLASEFLAPCVQLLECDNLGLIGIE